MDGFQRSYSSPMPAFLILHHAGYMPRLWKPSAFRYLNKPRGPAQSTKFFPMTMSEIVHVCLCSQLCSLAVRDRLLHMHKTSSCCVHPGISKVHDKTFLKLNNNNNNNNNNSNDNNTETLLISFKHESHFFFEMFLTAVPLKIQVSGMPSYVDW